MFGTFKTIVRLPKSGDARPKRAWKLGQRMKVSVMDYLIYCTKKNIDQGNKKTIREHVLQVESRRNREVEKSH